MWFKKKIRITDSNEFNKRLVEILDVENAFEVSLFAGVGEVPKAYVGVYLNGKQELLMLELLEQTKWRAIKDGLPKYSGEKKTS